MGGGAAINAAYKKYGKENFVKTIIANYPTRKEASDHERMAVTMIQVNDEMCYNLRTGGDNEHMMSEETRKKIGDTNRGIKRTPEMNKARSEQFSGESGPFYGKNHTEETKKYLSEMQLGELNHFYGKHHTKETKQFLSDLMTGKYCGEKSPKFGAVVSAETRLKISIANTGKKRTDEQRELIRVQTTGENNPFYGKCHTDETKEKIKEKRKLQITSEETKKLISQNHRGSIPCLIDGITYQSIKEATKSLSMDRGTIKRRLDSELEEFKNWKYCDETIWTNNKSNLLQ